MEVNIDQHLDILLKATKSAEEGMKEELRNLVDYLVMVRTKKHDASLSEYTLGKVLDSLVARARGPEFARGVEQEREQKYLSEYQEVQPFINAMDANELLDVLKELRNNTKLVDIYKHIKNRRGSDSSDLGYTEVKVTYREIPR